jgi:hypothetical protein
VVFHSNLIGIGFSAIAMLFSGAFYTLVPILFPAHLSAHPPLSIPPALDAFQLRF